MFDRLAKGWALTAEGEALLARAARMDDEAQAFARAALEVASLQGVVRISAPRCNKCVAKLCRSVCGLAGLVTPLARMARFSARLKVSA